MNHSKDIIKVLGEYNTDVSKKLYNQNYNINSQNLNEFIIGEEVTKQKMGKEIISINELELGEFVLFEGKICQVNKLFNISNNVRLNTKFGARNVILKKNCNLFRLLSSHSVGKSITPDRISNTVDHISKLKDKQWVLHNNKLAQIINHNSVDIITDEGILRINLDKESLTTLKD